MYYGSTRNTRWHCRQAVANVMHVRLFVQAPGARTWGIRRVPVDRLKRHHADTCIWFLSIAPTYHTNWHWYFQIKSNQWLRCRSRVPEATTTQLAASGPPFMWSSCRYRRRIWLNLPKFWLQHTTIHYLRFQDEHSNSSCSSLSQHNFASQSY